MEIALESRHEFPTNRRLSTDLRFIRRMRQGLGVPKSRKDINFSDVSNGDVVFKTPDNEVIMLTERSVAPLSGV